MNGRRIFVTLAAAAISLGALAAPAQAAPVERVRPSPTTWVYDFGDVESINPRADKIVLVDYSNGVPSTFKYKHFDFSTVLIYDRADGDGCNAPLVYGEQVFERFAAADAGRKVVFASLEPTRRGYASATENSTVLLEYRVCDGVYDAQDAKLAAIYGA